MVRVHFLLVLDHCSLAAINRHFGSHLSLLPVGCSKFKPSCARARPIAITRRSRWDSLLARLVTCVAYLVEAVAVVCLAGCPELAASIECVDLGRRDRVQLEGRLQNKPSSKAETRAERSTSKNPCKRAGDFRILPPSTGPGSWVFFSPVSKLWKQCYEHVDAAALQRPYPGATIRLTAYGNVFSSPSCVRWACKHGLQALFSTRLLQVKAGAWADLDTLLAAQELGLQVTGNYMKAAAAGRGRLPVLQLLYSAQ
eukprot:13497-Heterococcus_DN1.PRE.1